MTPYTPAGTKATFNTSMRELQSDLLKSLVGKTIDDAVAADDILDKKGNPRTGLVLTIEGKKFGLMSWDIRLKTITTFPTKDKVEFVPLDDFLHTTATRLFQAGGDEKAWLDAIAAAIKGKKCGVKLYPAQSLKGGSYQGCVFIVE